MAVSTTPIEVDSIGERSGPVEPTAPAPARRRGGRKSSPEKRMRILQVAARHFSERDYHAVCVEHIAKDAGVSKGTVFRYFESKENLFLAIVHHAVEMAIEGAQKAIEGEEDLVERIRRALTAVIRLYYEHGGLFRVLHHDKSFRCSQERKDLLEKRSRLRLFLKEIIEQGISEGRFRPVDAEFAATMIFGMVRSALYHYRDERSPDELAASMVDLALKGIENQPAA